MKKQFDINPFISVGEIKFGMMCSEVREKLGEYSDYKNRAKGNKTADCFDLCHVFYDEEQCAEFIVFHALDEINLFWEANALSEMTKQKLISFFSERDNNLLVEDYGHGIVGIRSNQFGIACYFTKNISTDEAGSEMEIDKVETISIAAKNYWK